MEQPSPSGPHTPAASFSEAFAALPVAKIEEYLCADGSDPAKMRVTHPQRTPFHDGFNGEAEVDDDGDSWASFLSRQPPVPRPTCDSTVQVKAVAAAITHVVVGPLVLPAVRPSTWPTADVSVRDLHRKTFRGHTRAVYGCAFAPGGEQFVTASRDKSVRVWNVADGTDRVMQGDDDSGYVLSCDFSPDDETVVSSSVDGTVRLWSASTCKHLHKLKGHGGTKAYCTQFSPSGAHVLSGGCDRKVRVWNTLTATQVARLNGHLLAVFSCCFSNTDGGKYCLSGSDDCMIKMWDWRETREVRTLCGHGGTVWSCRFSNSDRYIISATMNHELKLWDAGSGQLIHNFVGHHAPTHHALFTGNDKYVLSCARDRTVMVWETETGRHVDTLTGHTDSVCNMDIQGNMLLTASLDETVQLWQLNLP